MSAVFGFRLPEDLRQYLQEQAKKYHTTISHYIVMLIFYDMMGEKRQENMKGMVKYENHGC